MKFYRILSFLMASAVSGLIVAILIWWTQPDWLKQLPEPPKELAVPFKLSGPVSYADAVSRAAPSVVSVFAVKVTKQEPNPLFENPIFQRFFGEELAQPRFQREDSLGSGVIVDSNGYILTNNHVIENARDIEVALIDGRRFRARIVGTDPETDLAVLQAAGDNLQIAEFGNSEDLRVGDVVLAIGNPFAVGQTVTMGIVSATGRNDLGITNFENFIQTDAAINPGNSGGALINAHGDVVGINTAIFSKSGGSHGIGFAIPVSLAKQVMQQIAEHGRVVRGWLGIAGQNMTHALAESLELDSTQGILVSAVLEGGPADQAGIMPGDLITAISGVEIHSSYQMLDLVAGKPPGTLLNIDLIRNGQPYSLQVTIIERPTKG